jgi:hypothetical protein
MLYSPDQSITKNDHITYSLRNLYCYQGKIGIYIVSINDRRLMSCASINFIWRLPHNLTISFFHNYPVNLTSQSHAVTQQQNNETIEHFIV